MHPRHVPFLLLLGLVAAADAAARVPLGAGEVACNQDQLAGILERTTLVAHGSDRLSQLTLTFGSPSGDITLLALRREDDHFFSTPRQPELHLWASTNPDEPTLLRNPERRLLPAISLSRNGINSDLVARSQRLEVTLNPTLDDAPPLASLLRIDNADSGGGGNSAQPGRGLGPLLEPCPDKVKGKLTSEDLHVMAVLAKVLRGSVPEGKFLDTEMTIFRGEAPEIYRVDLVGIRDDGSHTGRMAVEVEVGIGGDPRRLTTGRLRVLPACAAGQVRSCSELGTFGQLNVILPVPQEKLIELGAISMVRINDGPEWEDSGPFSWAVVLQGSTWLRPWGS